MRRFAVRHRRFGRGDAGARRGGQLGGEATPLLDVQPGRAHPGHHPLAGTEEAQGVQHRVHPPDCDAVVLVVRGGVVNVVVLRWQDQPRPLQQARERGRVIGVRPLVELVRQHREHRHEGHEHRREEPEAVSRGHAEERDRQRHRGDDAVVAVGFDQVVVRDSLGIDVVLAKRPDEVRADERDALATDRVAPPVHQARQDVGGQIGHQHGQHQVHPAARRVQRAGDRHHEADQQRQYGGDGQDLHQPVSGRVSVRCNVLAHATIRKCTKSRPPSPGARFTMAGAARGGAGELARAGPRRSGC